MTRLWSRRRFLRQSFACALAGAGGLPYLQASGGEREDSKAPDHALTVISGRPRARGRQYGARFKDAVGAFLDKEIYDAFANKPSPKDDLYRYAGQCGQAVRKYSPIIMDELEGMAEGSGLRVEEALLLTLHEELFHRKPVPGPGHCTVLAAGPPDTSDGNAYIGQTWDWMASVYGLSNMLRWERPEGPSLLTYAYPGLWVGAGVNSAGLAFGWTSAFDAENIPGPRAGIPAYVLIAHLLYQESLDAVVEEAKRAEHAGWFTLVFADDQGRFANLEISPKERTVELHQGHIARCQYGSRQLTRTPEGQAVRHSAKCRRGFELLSAAKGKIDQAKLQEFLGDRAICAPPNNSNFTVDTMLFNTTKREAHVTRGPATPGRWQKFALPSSSASRPV